jgi:glycosyltransferase involved in cell wall biosynthesis
MNRCVLIVGRFRSSNFTAPGVCEDLAARLGSVGWSVIKTSSRPGRLARLLDMTCTAWYQRHRYQVAQVDLFSGRPFLLAEVVCSVLRQAGKPYILTLHGGNLPSFARRCPRRVSHLLRSSAMVTTPSRYLLEKMRPYRADLCLLPNALDTSVYPFNHRKTPRHHLTWLRQFHDVYNPSLALRVVQLLAGDYPNIRLTMVGPDKGDGYLLRFQQSVKKLGLADRVTLPGGVAKAEVPYWLDQGDIFLNTTNTDNTPVSVLEAMACGLCVISTNVGGIPYLLESEHDALLVPPDDPAAMTRAVRRLLTEEGLAERLSGNARRKAEQFDWSNILPRWEALLTGVAMGHTV